MPSPWEHPSPSSGRRDTHLLGGLLACRSLLLASRGSPPGLVGSGAVVVLGACGRAGGGAGFFSSFSLSCGTQRAETLLGRPQPCWPTSGSGYHTHTHFPCPLPPALRRCFLQTPPHTKHHLPLPQRQQEEDGGHWESSGGEPTSQATLLQ